MIVVVVLERADGDQMHRRACLLQFGDHVFRVAVGVLGAFGDDGVILRSTDNGGNWTKVSEELGGYTLANDRLVTDLLSQPLKLTQVIGVKGGTIQLLGHTLVVPAGAAAAGSGDA